MIVSHGLDTMKRHGYGDWETRGIMFDEQSYDKLYREILDVKIRQGDAQDLARMKRKINISGHIASAATMFAALSDENNLLAPRRKVAVSIHLTFNQDGVSLLQKDDQIKGNRCEQPRELGISNDQLVSAQQH